MLQTFNELHSACFKSAFTLCYHFLDNLLSILWTTSARWKGGQLHQAILVIDTSEIHFCGFHFKFCIKMMTSGRWSCDILIFGRNGAFSLRTCVRRLGGLLDLGRLSCHCKTSQSLSMVSLILTNKQVDLHQQTHHLYVAHIASKSSVDWHKMNLRSTVPSAGRDPLFRLNRVVLGGEFEARDLFICQRYPTKLIDWAVLNNGRMWLVRQISVGWIFKYKG
jgi:hypothetical protein